MTNRIRFTLAALLAVPIAIPALALPGAHGTLPKGSIQIRSAAAVVWNDGPPSMPKGAKMAVLEGDPKKEGMFTIRIDLPAGSKIAPHWHPREERVTVLEGEVRIVLGETTDAPSTTISSGGFYVNGPKVPHSVSFPQKSVIQITGLGPWELHFLDEK